MNFQHNAEELYSIYPPPEFDVDLCRELLEQIGCKSSLTSPESNQLAKSITEKIGWYCVAFEYGFIDEIDDYIGDDNYGIRVYLSRKNPTELKYEN